MRTLGRNPMTRFVFCFKFSNTEVIPFNKSFKSPRPYFPQKSSKISKKNLISVKYNLNRKSLFFSFLKINSQYNKNNPLEWVKALVDIKLRKKYVCVEGGRLLCFGFKREKKISIIFMNYWNFSEDYGKNWNDESSLFYIKNGNFNF